MSAASAVRSSLAGRLSSAASRLLVRVLRALPPRARVRLRERLVVQVPLDYPRADLRLQVDSPAVLGRARACAKEPATVAWLERELRPGDVVYDVGANVGAYSLIAAACAPDVRVVAFEPGYADFANLCANVHHNALADRITPLPLALAEHSGLLAFAFSDLAAGAAEHSAAEHRVAEHSAAEHSAAENGAVAGAARARQSVPALRLDDAVAMFALPPPELVKIDVDGAELAVLRGATALLRCATLRSLLVEVCTGEPASAIEALLRAAGFSVLERCALGRPGIHNWICGRVVERSGAGHAA